MPLPNVTADFARFEEAIEWFRARVVLTDEEFSALRAAARGNAFRVAGVAQLSIVQQVFDMIGRALEQGMSVQEFKKAAKPVLRRAWSLRGKAEAARLNLIYRNAVQRAYNRGRHQQLSKPAIKRVRPFWVYDAVLDSRTSAICRGLDQTILPADDTFWDTHTPPLHHGCRSSIRALRPRQVERRGGVTGPRDINADTGFGLSPRAGELQVVTGDLSKFDPELMREHNRKQGTP